uniref:Drf_GBD domain-containing protein n=1 Tax=Angiostrongylus cantonensis TaxID=6313 RepID=A0A0K0D6X8_ANGCA
LDLTTGMDAVLFAVNSPQLDSKCYAVEILLLLLDKHQGFVVLMRALTAMTARSRDYIRLTLFVSQLKHGLHTQKLHIQILIVRLFNKLLATAPSSLHRSLIRSEIMLSRFSAEYVENLITTQSAPLGGMDILANELDLWRSLGSSTTPSYSFEQSRIYGLSEVENDSSQGGRSRNSRPPSSKYPIASSFSVDVSLLTIFNRFAAV